jgi:hypothetical protein
MKKQKIEELIDSDGNLIGDDDYPETGSNKEGDANNTTDYNARVHGQNFKNDFLGRFGFYFYESVGEKKPAIVEAIESVVGEVKTKEILHKIKPVVENALESIGGFISEGKVVEDRLVDKKDNDIKKKKDYKELKSAKLEKVAGLLNKLNKDDLNKLVNLLELKK